MFLPIGDSPNPKGTPFLTYLLIALNVAVYLFVNLPLGAQRPRYDDPRFLAYVEVMAEELANQEQLRQLVAQASAYDLFAFEHGYRPNAPQISDLFTCMFLHGGLMHLFGNMLFLWIYGDNVERRLGSLPYLVAYLATGIVATLAHALVFADSPVPLVGASGAISGVLGYYFVLFPRNTVRVLAFLPPFLLHVFLIPARLVLGMYLLVDNLLPFLFAGAGGVAHGAHIGGFIAGALASWFVDRRGLGQARPVEKADEPLTPLDAVELAAELRAQGEPLAALDLLRRASRDHVRGPGVGDVHALAGLILLEDLRQPTTAFQYLLAALELGASPPAAAQARAALARIDALQKRSIGRLHTPRDW